jgi:L-ribulose-5-phosphate 3-epimerase
VGENSLTRRQFAAGSAAVLTGLSLHAAAEPRYRKGITLGSFPKGQPLEKCFAQAKEHGFQGVEISLGEQVNLTTSDDDLKRYREAADKNGVAIVNLWVSGAIAKTPLNAADPKVRAQGVAGLRRGIKMAGLLGTDSILVVPGAVGWGNKMEYGYEETWDRVSAEIPKVVGDAEKAGVFLNFEEVWNRFSYQPPRHEAVR